MAAAPTETPAGTGPIFLAGIDRSGIGLLGELLERHPRIAMTRRTDFWSRTAGRFGDLRQPANVERCLAAMAQDRRTRVFIPDRPRLLAELAPRPTYPHLFELLQRQHAERLGKARWGDKSLGSERYAELLLRTYPDARIVHVVRDPRDRYASQKHHRGVGRGELGAAAAMWRWSARLAARNARRYPDRYLVVRYETLVSEPETTLRGVFAFLGETYPDRFLAELEPPSGGSAAGGGGEGPGPIHGRSVGRFREVLRGDEVWFLQLAAGRLLRRAGYEAERVELTGGRLRIVLLALPRHAVRLLLWGPWTRLQLATARPPQR